MAYPVILLPVLAITYRMTSDTAREGFVRQFEALLLGQTWELENLFSEVEADLKTLAMNPAVTDADDSLFTSFLEADPDTFTYRYTPEELAIISLFNAYRVTHPAVNSVYMGRANGTFVRSHERAAATAYDPRTRPWYLAALEYPGKLAHTAIYPSVTTRDLNVGTSLALSDPQGRLRGVLGMDVTLEDLSRRFESLSLPYGAWLELWDAEGRVAISPAADRVSQPARAGAPPGSPAAASAAEVLPGKVLCLYRRIPIPEGYLAVLIPGAAIGSLVNQSLAERAVIITATFLLGYASLFILLNRSLLKPLRAMSAHLRASADEGIPAPMRVPTSGELHELEVNYNRLVEMVELENEELRKIKFLVITSLSSLAQKRDNETGLHILRTQKYMDILATAYNQCFPARAADHARVRQMVLCAPLHDIGKVAIPDSILLKPGRLDSLEFEIMKMHTTYGRDAIEKAQVDLADQLFFSTALAIVYSHHERWDGKGYPEGLEGESIPLEARFMAIADVYDALVTERVYKKAMGHEEAVRIIREGRGSQFDPDVVDAFLVSERMFREVAVLYGDTLGHGQ